MQRAVKDEQDEQRGAGAEQLGENETRNGGGGDAGAMPVKVSDSVRARVTAGLAKLVELVNQ